MNDQHIRGRWTGPQKELPANTVMRYAVAAGAAEHITYIEGLAAKNVPPLPYVGDVLTVPFLVHPATREPLPVVVVDIVELLDMTPPTIAIVVGLMH